MLTAIIHRAQQALATFFAETQVEKAAKQTQFVQRQSKLTGTLFLKALVLGFIQHPRASLTQLCQVCLDFKVDITPQGLDDRLTPKAVAFLEGELERALSLFRAQQRAVAVALDQFAAVYFLDSTVISLPETLKDVFPGVGGNASRAAVKIQLLFDFLTGNLAYLEFVPGRQADQGFQHHLPALVPNSLVIQDLGYFKLASLQMIAAQGAFFLTRWHNQSQVFLAHDPEQALEMLAFLRQQHAAAAEYAVLLGANTQIANRLICVRLPTAVAAQRRRRAKADAQRRRKAISKRTLALLDWNIFLTNTPAERLSLRQILVCYSFRWQIELIFKLWKSETALKHLRGVRKERVLCELYARMIGIVLAHFLFAPLQFLLRKQGVEISPVKACQTFQDRAKSIALTIGDTPQQLRQELEELCQRILRFGRKNKRKKHLSTYAKFLAADTLNLAELYPLA